ncbi:hypothetical protein NDN08_005626 [Rhodosorus marinus]|uniref:Potassium channel domain-containing protein n=1 Tax=Rhodosorus marinus TaxID=101924 RepID=A0AAV8V441_9RHOD|nr:hypothetical protein NDN08_005626 [Rhodosorus marinus]
MASGAVKEYPPPHWDTVEDVAFWAIVSFLISLLITFEHYLLVKLGGVSGIVNQTLLATQSEQGRRNLMTRVGSAVRVFRANVAYLRKVQHVVFWHLAVVRALVSALVCGLYVYCTYLKRVPDMIVWTQTVVGFMFAAFHAFKIWTDDAPLLLVFSLTNVLECLTIASLLMSNQALWLNFNFFRAYHVWIIFEKTLKAPNVQRRFKFFISRQIVELVAQACMFLYIVASGLQLFELIGDPTESVRPDTFALTFVNSLYFSTVSALTVGYGDFVPRSTLGRFWVVGIVFLGAYLISVSVGQSLNAISAARRGAGRYFRNESARHIVVCGCVQWEYLKHFLAEFFGEEKNRDHRVVVICRDVNWTKDAWREFQVGLNIQSKQLLYLDGSTQTLAGLKRAEVATAEAVFVLARPHSSNPAQDDSEVTKHVLAIRNHNHSIRIYAMCILRDTVCAIEDVLEPEVPQHTETPHARSYNIQGLISGIDNLIEESAHDVEKIANCKRLLCMQNIETMFVAENVFCNGLSTLMVNGISRIHPAFKEDDKPWLHEYKVGAECDFHALPLPDNIDGHSYIELVMPLQDRGAVLMAVRVEHGDWDNCDLRTKFSIGMYGMFLTYHEVDALQDVLERVSSGFKPIARTLARSMASYRLRKDGQHLEPEDPGKPLLPQAGSSRGGSSQPPALDAEQSNSLTTKSVFEEGNSSGYSSDNSIDIGPSYAFGSPSLSPRELPGLPNRKVSARKKRRSSKALSIDVENNLYTKSPMASGSTRLQNALNPKETDFKIYRNTDLPVHLRRHLIVCLIGSVSLVHLERFISRLWRRRSGHKRNIPVVAVHRKFPDDFEQQMARYRGSLYLLEGSSQSIYTLQKAQFKSASSIVLLAMEEWQNQEDLDAKALFTVMTLDQLLPENSSTYVCSVVDAEDSIQLLRPPVKARRKGVQLGEIHHPMMLPKRGGVDFAAGPSRFEQGMPSQSTESMSGLGQKSSWMRSFNGTSIFDNLHRAKHMFTTNLREETGPKSSVRRRTAARAERARSHHKRHEGTLEGIRFASGEIFISTHVVSMMVRDYNMAGFIDFLFSRMVVDDQQIRAENNLWWRLIDVPEEWISGSTGTVIYRDAFVRLANINCVAVGLYRSGDAPVRIREESTNKPNWNRDTRFNDETRASSRGDVLFGLDSSQRRARNTGSSWILDGQISTLLGESVGIQSYICPTTGAEMEYREIYDGENSLPYVYTMPEPYTALSATDAIFVHCHPDLEVPTDWFRKPISPGLRNV